MMLLQKSCVAHHTPTEGLKKRLFKGKLDPGYLPKLDAAKKNGRMGDAATLLQSLASAIANVTARLDAVELVLRTQASKVRVAGGRGGGALPVSQRTWTRAYLVTPPRLLPPSDRQAAGLRELSHREAASGSIESQGAICRG